MADGGESKRRWIVEGKRTRRGKRSKRLRDRGGERDVKEGERDTRVEGNDDVVVDSVVNRSNKGLSMLVEWRKKPPPSGGGDGC